MITNRNNTITPPTYTRICTPAMNSAPASTNSAATETSDEIRNSALCTALRAITVNNPAKIAASAKIQKKRASYPDNVMYLVLCSSLLKVWLFPWCLDQAQSTKNKGLTGVLHRLAALFQHLTIPDEA